MTPQIHLTSWDQSKDSEVDSGRGSGPGQPEAPPPTLGISLGNPSSMSQPRRLCLAPTGWHCPQLSPAPSESAPSPNGMIHLARFHRLKSQTHARLPPGNAPPNPGAQEFWVLPTPPPPHSLTNPRSRRRRTPAGAEM